MKKIIVIVDIHITTPDERIIGLDTYDRFCMTRDAALHIHRTISGSTRGVPWTMFKSTGHQCPLDLTTPDSSISVDEPAAYGLLLLAPDGVVAHTEDVLPARTIARDQRSVSP